MTKKTHFDFYKKIAKMICSGTMLVFIACNIIPATAAIIQRTTPSATTATTPRPASSRMPTMTTKLSTVPKSATNTGNTGTGATNNNNVKSGTNTTTDDTSGDSDDEIIEDKTSQFDSVLESASNGTTDASTQSLADLIRAQRAALDAATAEEFSNKNNQNVTSGLSACDSGLRACMQEKCGKDFTKCSGDGDTIWGDKMDACRRKVTCSGEEYRLFTIEIKADRDLNARMSSYQKILDCGNSYNACIEEQCGAKFNKCLGKKAGDAAIAKCASIARDCNRQDSGLAARAMEVFATLRQDAEKQIKRDEQRLYELRDKMRSRCQTLGALFDERSLDCVFTVEFWAGTPKTSLYASKKAYAGSTFDCTQDWFGVDITTFKENAYRLTRDQKSASSALLGSGLGMAVGSVTSGMIDRAIDRHKAERAVKKAAKEDKECKRNKDCGDGMKCKKNKCVPKNANGDDEETPAEDDSSDKECKWNKDCGDGMKCKKNKCVPRNANGDAPEDGSDEQDQEGDGEQGQDGDSEQDQEGDGEQDQDGSGEQGQDGSGEQDQDGDSEQDQDGSGEQGQDGSGEQGQDGSGDQIPEGGDDQGQGDES